MSLNYKKAFLRQTALILSHYKKGLFLQETDNQINTTPKEQPITPTTPGKTSCPTSVSQSDGSYPLPYHDYAVIILAVLMIPTLAFGADSYGTEVLKGEATNLKELLFGPILRIAGVIGAVFGIIRSFQTQSLQPIFIFGGIGAATIIVPKLLDVMFKVA